MKSGWQEYRLDDTGLDHVELDWPMADSGSRCPGVMPRLLLSLRRAGSLAREESAPNQSRRDWLAKRGFDHRSSLSLPLIHSRKVWYARTPADLACCQGDGVVSDNPSGHIVLTVADCMPIYLYDPASSAYALLHSGWQGTGILEDACNFMADRFNTRTDSLLAVFGPHIGSCCYAVAADRADLYAQRFGSSAVDLHGGLPRLHLLNANLAVAERLGIRYLAYTRTCTGCNAFLGSFRREGAASFTRMAAVVGYPAIGLN